MRGILIFFTFLKSVSDPSVPIEYNKCVMAELSTRDSFIVRVYRFDTEDSAKVSGLIEAIDGSGANSSFKNMNELGAILNKFVNRRKKSKERR